MALDVFRRGGIVVMMLSACGSAIAAGMDTPVEHDGVTAGATQRYVEGTPTPRNLTAEEQRIIETTPIIAAR